MSEVKKTGVSQAMKDALAASGRRQADLAKELGVNQSSISGAMNRPKVGIDVVIEFFELLGYNVCIVKKDGKRVIPVYELEKQP